MAAQPLLTNPILFVTQVPQPSDFTTVTALFGNHRGGVDSAPRGGDLWICYSDGTLRNLTREAGFGRTGAQHTNGIAVREPSVHWSGTKAVFSMVIGSPQRQYEVATYYWQLYEITGFGVGETPVITKVSNQPTNYNNVAPAYGTDGRIIFASDRPRDGRRHLWPQLDEYEEAPVVSGLWSLNPASGDLFLLTHTPSGAFSPSIDSFGRVVFVRWDHLQRDQQADTDNASGGSGTYGTFNYSDESATALMLTNNRAEIFPEARQTIGNVNAFTFNHFFPWQIHEDGTEEETLNHVGRHELGGSYRSVSFNDDPNLQELYYFGNKYNTNTISNFIQIRESPVTPGFYFGIDAPEFGTHSGGQIVTIEAHAATNADLIRLRYLTPRATASSSDTPPTDHTGLYRNPLPLSDGRLAAIHTAETRQDQNIGTSASPRSRYDFRLKLLKFTNGFWMPDVPLTPGISNSVTWWSPDVLMSYTGALWELDPVEVRARPVPPRIAAHVEPIEQRVFADEGVDIGVLQAYLRQRNLALIVSRNVTGRDKGDRQQPFNLRVPGGTQTLGAGGKIYDIAFFQLYQADLIRGTGLRNSTPNAGRRALAQRLHDPLVENPVEASAPAASVRIASDGSVAAFVPARRALSWQMTGTNGTPVVRERYWITFQPGEIRTCANCHGVNTADQAGRPAATNAPLALRELLRHWKTNNVPQVTRVSDSGTNFLAITFKRSLAVSNFTHRVEVSSDLTNWFAGSIYSATGAIPNTAWTREVSRSGGSPEVITVRDSFPMSGGTNRFLRVQVSP